MHANYDRTEGSQVSDTASEFEMRDKVSFELAGEAFTALLSGALYWPRQNALLLADLHLEKGSAFAQRGQFLPPYDSLQTLNQLAKDITRYEPEQVICLGDSFHDIGGPDRLPSACREILTTMMLGRRWYWISGNHDPQAPASLGGEAQTVICLDGIGLTHEPGSLLSAIQDGEPEVKAEIAGHLHPVAKISNRQRGRSLRRRAFVVTQQRVILPAYGSYTGGLDVQHVAFQPFLTRETRLIVIGRQTLSLLNLSVHS
ncbi:ligase-associated DNA damage response endonuclease PdeM [Cohaesibacter celericrescens]|uniref:Calcineurin-like phosphoesterase domain-containing protein n=1 Tax=Cohaesibacter celericrescens TaxID=2067669 RepID=A0A2N5XK29_9HYPH|nr:ligase-associated DNA damage response endonuclease PdeM [Cohaesibacter celericrescens]PLW74873.1 hypothetical protein C0081_21395 [Cohaesibacter celericrescens]